MGEGWRRNWLCCCFGSGTRQETWASRGFLWRGWGRAGKRGQHPGRASSRVLSDYPGSHMGFRKAHQNGILRRYPSRLAPHAKPRLAWISQALRPLNAARALPATLPAVPACQTRCPPRPRSHHQRAGSDKAWPRAAARGRAQRPLSARAASLRAARHDSSSGSASLDTRWCIDRSMPSNLSRRVPRARPLRARPTPPSGSTAHERWLRRALASSLLASCCPARGDGSAASNAEHCPAQRRPRQPAAQVGTGASQHGRHSSRAA